MVLDSSTYPCTWYFAHKAELDQQGVLRSIENISQYYNEWQKAGGYSKKSKDFMNCTNLPIIKSDDESKSFIIDFIVPPELHLMLGVVNHIFNHMLKDFGTVASMWAEKCHVQKQIFRGCSGFDGNSCKKLLNNIDTLRAICPLECLKFVKALNDFHLVVKSCFSSELKSDYVHCIF